NEIAIKPSILKEKYNKITDNLFFATIVPMFFIVLGLGLTIPVAQNETQRLRQDLVQYNLKQNYKDDLSKVVGLLNITTLERSELKELGTKNKEIEKIIEKNKLSVILLYFSFNIEGFIAISLILSLNALKISKAHD
ncbi:hypothetical protein J831_4525, partial [Acinetobacter baumannii 25691_8]